MNDSWSTMFQSTTVNWKSLITEGLRIFVLPSFLKGAPRWPETGFEHAIFWLKSQRLNLSATELGRIQFVVESKVDLEESKASSSNMASQGLNTLDLGSNTYQNGVQCI